METIYNAVVFGGAGVFSKNIKYQMPHLVWQFPEDDDFADSNHFSAKGSAKFALMIAPIVKSSCK